MKTIHQELLDTPRVRELQKRKRAIQTKKRVVYGVLFLVLVSGLIAFSYASRFRITHIVIEGNVVTETSEILSRAQQKLEGRYLFVFSKKHAWIAPKKGIEKALSGSFPRFSEVTVSGENMNTVRIHVTERTGAYLWCGEIFTPTSTPCYFLDDTGYVFAEAPGFSGNVFFRFYGPLTDRDTSHAIGGYVMSDADFVYAKRFIAGMKNLGIKPYAFVSTTIDERYLYIEHPSGDLARSPKLILSNKDDVVTVLQNFESAYNAEPLKTEFANKLPNLATVDLRFKNKVYYTYR